MKILETFIAIPFLWGCAHFEKPRVPAGAPVHLSAAQILRMHEITSYFENSTPTPQYDYIENLKDGRGYTSGIAGFTTADEDVSELFKIYCPTHPKARLCGFRKEIDRLAANGSADVRLTS